MKHSGGARDRYQLLHDRIDGWEGCGWENEGRIGH